MYNDILKNSRRNLMWIFVTDDDKLYCQYHEKHHGEQDFRKHPDLNNVKELHLLSSQHEAIFYSKDGRLIVDGVEIEFRKDNASILSQATQVFSKYEAETSFKSSRIIAEYIFIEMDDSFRLGLCIDEGGISFQIYSAEIYNIVVSANGISYHTQTEKY